MAHTLTAGQKTTQRKPGQWSKTYLAVPEYHTIYTAQLDGVPSSNDMVAEITVDHEIGTRADVLADMTLYVGTSAGAFDLGMCRIRKTPIAGTFYISETADIVWQDNAHLTVVDDYSLWQKSLRIIGSEPFMDWDVEYHDQHEDFDPVPVMGTHHVARLTGASVDVHLGPSADTSAWVIGSSIASQNWSVAGATLDDSTAINPIATFTAAGTYLVYCLFTAANGKTFTGVRYVIIWDDAHPLIEHFILSNGRGSIEGSYSFDVTLFSDFSASSLRKRSLVILCTEDYAENTSVVMPGQIEGAENILCVGWVTDINNDRNSNYGEISLTVQSAEYWMKQIRDYPSGLALKVGTAEAWTDMPGLTTDRAMWHFLHWRSTATRVLDFIPTDDTRLASQFNIARANLWERLVQVSTPVIFAAPHVDNFGRLFAFIEPQMVPLDDRTWPVVMTVEDRDLEDTISWVRRDVTPLSMLFFSGIAVSSSTSASSYFSLSPGHSYAHHGEEEAQDNYLVADQANSNELCGLYYGWKNNPLDNLEFRFAHSMRVLGLFPRQYFYFEIDAANDPRGIGFAGNLIPREVNFSVDPDTGFISISATMEPESFPGPAVNGDVPTMEDVDFSTPDDIPFDPILPDDILVILPPSLENLNLPSTVAIASDNFGVMYSDNVNNGEISKIAWKSMNSGLSPADIAMISKLIKTPNGTLYIMTDVKVFAAQKPGGAFKQIAEVGEFGTSAFMYDIAVNPLKQDEIVIMAGQATDYQALALASYSSPLDFSSLNPLGSHYRPAIVFADNGWWFSGTDPFAQQFIVKINAGLSSASAGFWFPTTGLDPFLVGVGSQGTVYQWNASPSDYKISDTTGATIFTALSINVDQFLRTPQSISPSPTGNYIMAADGTLKTPKLSTDGGSSWVTTSLTVGPGVWENCADDNRWLFGGGANIRITLDRGATDINLIGNLISIAPLINIVGIRFIK